MSVIADRHTVVPFVAGKTAAFQDQRLAKVGYKDRTDKNGKTTKAKLPSIAVSVPKITSIEGHLTALLPHIVSMLETTQDSIIRSLYESSEGTLSNVADSDISIGACVAFLEAEAEGDRLSKERIGKWFDSDVRENLAIYVADKLGTENLDDARITAKCAAFRGLFALLASKNLFLQPPQIAGLRTALTFAADSDDGFAEKIGKKIDKVESESNVPADAAL